MSDPKRYTDLQVWEALHFGGSTNGWIRWEDYKRIVDHINEASLDAKNVNVVLSAENARLQAEVERLESMADENAHLHKGIYSLSLNVVQLKDEVERLRASSFVTAVPVEQYERVIKAGSEMSAEMRFAWLERIRTNKEQREAWLKKVHQCLIDWEAAKEGKQP